MLNTKGLVQKVNAYKEDTVDGQSYDHDDIVRQISDRLQLDRNTTSSPRFNLSIANDNKLNARDYTSQNLQADNDDNKDVVQPIPLPVQEISIDRELDLLADIAKESTQKNVVSSLSELISDTEMSVSAIEDSSESSLEHLNVISDVLTSIGGILTKGFDSLIGVFTGQFGSLYKATTDISDGVNRSADISATEYEDQRRNEVLGEAQDHQTAGNVVMEKVGEIISTIGDIFDKVATKIRDSIIRFFEDGGHFTIWDRVKDGLIKLAAQGIAVIAVMTASLDFWTRPDGLSRYFEAFQNVWSAIKDIFGDFSTKLSGWWSSEGEGNFNVIGAFINDTIIFLLGTALPASLRLVKDQLLTSLDAATSILAGFADLVYGVINIITGLFTWDPEEGAKKIYAGFEQISSALDKIIGGVVEFLWKTLDNAVTYILRFFTIDKAIGMGEDQTFFQRIGEIFTNMWNGILDYFNKGTLAILADIGKAYVYIYDTILTYIARLTNFDKLIGMSENDTLLGYIWERIKDLMEVILDFIPTKNDIIKYINDTVASWSPSDYITEMLKLDLEPEVTKTPAATTIQADPDRHLSDIEQKVSAMPTNVNQMINMISDNKTITNVSNAVTSAGQKAGRAIGSISTRPEQSGMDRILQGSLDFFRSR